MLKHTTTIDAQGYAYTMDVYTKYPFCTVQLCPVPERNAFLFFWACFFYRRQLLRADYLPTYSNVRSKIQDLDNNKSKKKI